MAGKCDIIGVILRIMNIHINNVGVCEQGCIVLKNATVDGKTTTK